MSISDDVRTQLLEHVDTQQHNIIFDDNKAITPTFAFCEANSISGEGMGEEYRIRISTSEGSAVAADADIADDIATDGDPGSRPIHKKWVLTPVTKEAPFMFTRDEMDAIEGMSGGKQFDVMADVMEKFIKALWNVLCWQCTGSGWGEIAQMEGIGSTYVDVDPAFTNRFKVGDRLVASVTTNTDVLLGSPAGTALRVTGVDPSTGRLTLSGDPTSVWANDDDMFLFRKGDRIATDPAAADDAKLCVTGVLGVINPDNTSLWGNTVTGNPQLTGYGYTGSGDTETQLLGLANMMMAQGKPPKIILVNGISWMLLQKTKQATQVVAVSGEKFSIGFNAIELPTVYGVAKILPDFTYPPGTAVAGPFDDKKEGPRFIHNSGKLVQLFKNPENGSFLRLQASLGSRDWIGANYFRGQVAVPGPGNYGRCDTLPTS